MRLSSSLQGRLPGRQAVQGQALQRLLPLRQHRLCLLQQALAGSGGLLLRGSRGEFVVRGGLEPLLGCAPC